MSLSNEQVLAAIKKNPVSVVCGVIALAIGAVIYLRMDLVGEAAKMLEQKTAEGERLHANVNNASQLPEQLAAISEARTEVDKRLVKGIDLAQNLQYFYRLEADTGVKILNLRQNPVAPTKPGVKNPPLIGIGFSVAFQAPYPVVMEFIRRLESGTHYSRITGGSMGLTGGNRTGPLTVSVSLELLGQP